MKQTSGILSTYTADTMGVASALFELGGMTVMHDASGCNSTYNTHDEPRWYDFDSMVYISALTETEAVMGDDEKLIADITVAAQELSPHFIAIAGTPIPMMAGTDLPAVAKVVEERTGIPSFGFQTNGMRSYISGAGMAFLGLAERFIKKNVQKTKNISVNVLGFTPLDFSVNTTVRSILDQLLKNDIEVVSAWAMNSTLEAISNAASAHVNLVVSQSGMAAAQYMLCTFGIPYVAGVPAGAQFTEKIMEDIRTAARTGESVLSFNRQLSGAEIAVIGEFVQSASIAKAIELACGKCACVLTSLEAEKIFLGSEDAFAPHEDDVIQRLKGIKTVIADPLYRPVCQPHTHFIALPHEAFSGRIYRKDIPDLVHNFNDITKEVKP